MRYSDHSPWPEGHPISRDKAKSLSEGSLGSFYKGFALSCSAPLFWFRSNDKPLRILHNGTITIVRTPRKLFGVTADHVIDQYEIDRPEGIKLQIKTRMIRGPRIIDRSPKRDLATFELDKHVIADLGLQPIEWPFRLPSEGGGLLLAGFRGNSKEYIEPKQLGWSPFFAIGRARTVSLDQITILVPPDDDNANNSLPLNYDFGGISGGPIIGLFETASNVACFRLSGVITEQPSYDGSLDSIERIVGTSAEAITEFGMIR